MQITIMIKETHTHHVYCLIYSPIFHPPSPPRVPATRTFLTWHDGPRPPSSPFFSLVRWTGTPHPFHRSCTTYLNFVLLSPFPILPRIDPQPLLFSLGFFQQRSPLITHTLLRRGSPSTYYALSTHPLKLTLAFRRPHRTEQTTTNPNASYGYVKHAFVAGFLGLPCSSYSPHSPLAFPLISFGSVSLRESIMSWLLLFEQPLSPFFPYRSVVYYYDLFILADRKSVV